MSRKSDYERLIDESILFSVDMEREKSAYIRESLKMVDYLYCYLMEINRKEYEPYGVEIVETAHYCIKNYNATLGRFLNYFISAWTNNYNHVIARDRFDSEHAAMKFTENQKREYMRYKKACSKLGIDKDSPNFEKKIAECMGISMSEIRDLLLIDDVKIESMDGVADTVDNAIPKQYDAGVSVENDFIRIDEDIRFLNTLETVFNGIQNRQKRMISTMLTAYLSLKLNNEIVLEVFRSKTYFDVEIYRECIKKREPISNKKIAERLGILEASLSRAWNSFKEKVERAIISENKNV